MWVGCEWGRKAVVVYSWHVASNIKEFAVQYLTVDLTGIFKLISTGKI